MAREGGEPGAGSAHLAAQELEAILLHVAEGIIVYDLDGRIVRTNPAAEALLHLGPEASQTLAQRALQHRFFREDGSQMAVEELPVLRALRGEVVRGVVLGLTREDGEPRWMRVSVSPLLVGGRQVGAVASFTDVTLQRRAEAELGQAQRALADQQRLLAAVIDGTPSQVWAFDRDGRVTLANAAAERFFGRPRDRLIGHFPEEWMPASMKQRARARHDRVVATGVVDLLEATVPDPAGDRAMLSALYPLRDERGHVYGTAAIATDITDLKRAEARLLKSTEETQAALAALEQSRERERRTEEKLRQAQKMEAVGRLAGGVAHDFNNLLTVILGTSSDLLSELPTGDPLRDAIGEIERAGQRAASLTRQLLAFSRKQVLEPRVVAVNELLTSSEKMVRRLIGEDVELTLLLNPRAGFCRLDPGQFEQLLLNLVVNARDAMPDGGRLTIETEPTTLDQSYADEHPEVAPGEYLRISVSDTGVGMTREALAHLFEPFFTTKATGKGTGLGLSTVYGIVKQSGGAIWVYSEPGQGATFKLYFPTVDASGADAPSLPRPPEAPGRISESVLLVEDDEQVRATVASMLRRAGYHVIQASNGGEALLICEQHPGSIHLLLTDVVMPRLNGRKLAERLKDVRPGLRVLFMSGYTENAIVHHGVLDPGLDFLAKPIVRDALLAKVREVLDR